MCGVHYMRMESNTVGKYFGRWSTLRMCKKAVILAGLLWYRISFSVNLSSARNSAYVAILLAIYDPKYCVFSFSELE